MTYNCLSPPNRFKPREFKEFPGGTHILASPVTLDMVLNLPLNLQKSTSSVLEFSIVETTPLFEGLYSRNGRLGPLVKLAWFTEMLSPE